MPKKSKQNVTRILNCLPSRNIENDWSFEAAESSFMAAARPPVPNAVDLRENWWKIGDQLDTGSCVGWGVADSVVRWHLVKLGRITPDDILSVRFVWMAAKETDLFILRPTTFIESDGTSIKAALDIVRKFGVVLDALLPFKNLKLYQGSSTNFYAIAANLRINAYYNLGTNQGTWRNWLANNGPIVTRLDVDATWDNAGVTQGNLDVYQPGTTRGGHAVALVGYTSDRFIARNSWGETWGDQGFGYASLQYAKDAFTEAYGIYAA